jgi:ATP-dependent RNA helicase DDX23/PRP28
MCATKSSGKCNLEITLSHHRVTPFLDTMSRPEPLSIESLLQKQRQEKEAASKVCAAFFCASSLFNRGSQQPKFLSKEERATLAIAKRAQEIREQKEKEEFSRKDRAQLEQEADEIRMRERSQTSGRYGNGGRRWLLFILFLSVC